MMDTRLGLVATRWKDSIILQTISTEIKSGAGVVTRRVSSKIVKVSCPNCWEKSPFLGKNHLKIHLSITALTFLFTAHALKLQLPTCQGQVV